jgi:2-oxoglutarate ferredoxin oxidoreductase subunit delta
MTANRQTKTQKVKVARKKKSKPNKTEVANSTVREKESAAQKKSFEVEFYRDWCKGCSICASFCPTEALSMNDKGEPEVVKPELCIGCAWCEIRCPDFAVRVKEKDEEQVREA